MLFVQEGLLSVKNFLCNFVHCGILAISFIYSIILENKIDIKNLIFKFRMIKSINITIQAHNKRFTIDKYSLTVKNLLFIWINLNDIEIEVKMI